jgi:DnaJ family protein B protein 11
MEESNCNYYEILGVNEKASKDEIKKAYRNLSFKNHPDKNQGNQDATSKFQKINEAYEILGDEEKKAEYDMTRNNPFFRMNNHGSGNSEMEVPIDEIFNAFFGGGPIFGNMGGFPGMPMGGKVHIFHGGPMGFQQAMQKPSPIIKNITINMEQVLNGAVVPIEIERWIVNNGIKVFEKETVYVTVPHGVDDGEIIILRNKGNSINENVKGDIKIIIKVKNDTLFKRVGLDLILEKTISLKDSLCGFSFEINYINGKIYTLNNNKGNIIPPGYKKLYANMGIKRGEHVGNMIILFNVDFPTQLTEDQIEKICGIL